MSLFQTSVVKKYLNDLSPELIDKKYKEFQAYFGDTERQENIRNSKEEEYQSGFINALFVNILGYTLNPEPNFNIVLEKKNVDDSKKADGAILKENEVVAVIELKSTQTTDLDTVETQAFGYKNHNPKCQYIITSNFEKIRLYIQNAIDHLEFDLFNLTREDFALLWLCFVKDNVLRNIPLKIKESSVLQEENVTKQLYKDYSKFRKEIFENIVKNNPEFDKLALFKKTQKLLDRFLFIFFAEDRLLLPPNSISEIVKQWTTLKEDLDEYIPLYERFKKYFGYLNTGFKGKKYDIFAYNGGLFLVDEILDNIKIDDEVLHHNTVQLSTYDFETDVDVNILGHIFEHSLSEIENVQAEIAGEVVEKQKTKRKKDGIFYTPKYITKYIVENTVGKLCEEKRNEFGIIDEEYAKGRKNRKKDIVRALDDKLTAYSDWLIEITILDPACGSGAFLNQALEFLIQEHKKIDELKFQLLGGSIVFPDIEAKILEKNIYGVDLNEESVEIAKLSLWLRTAQKGRKLTTLSNHIKCGNSLIDDSEIAGEKAFNWKNEFPKVFDKGGFDVIIGNPPYGASFNALEKKYLKEYYSDIHVRTPESYNYFIYKITELLSKIGEFGVIIPSSFLNQFEFEKNRKFLKEKFNISKICNLGDEVFQDVATPTCIMIISNPKTNKSTQYINLQSMLRMSLVAKLFDYEKYLESKDFASNSESSFIVKQNADLIRKCYTFPKLEDIAEDVATGISPGLGDAFVKTEKQVIEQRLERKILRKLIIGGEINRYHLSPKSTKSVIYATTKTKIDDYPQVFNALSEYKEKLDNRVETKSGRIPWYVMLRPRREKLFLENKILIRQTADRILASYDINQWHCLKSGIIIQLSNKSNLNYFYLLAILNSKLMNFLYQDMVNESTRIFPEVKPINLFKLPIPDVDEACQNSLIIKAQKISSLYLEFSQLEDNLNNFIVAKLNIGLSKKLQNCLSLAYKEFLKELEKSCKAAAKEKGTEFTKLSLSEEAEWMQYFKEQREKVQIFKTEINKIDKEIDQIVYELYGLTEEEIEIVEEMH